MSIDDKLKAKTEETLDMIKNLYINKIVLTTLGNSISTGFSQNDDNKPLLDRNEYLKELADKKGIKLEIHKFSRSENNSDEKTFDLIIDNVKESDIDSLNTRDYFNHLRKEDRIIVRDPIIKMYPQTSDTKIQDILFNNDDSANIVIYNGGTGAVLDNLTRKGNVSCSNSIKKDISYIESTLGLIQNNNRNNNSNTQVYMCGAPRIYNTRISDLLINNKIKPVLKRYSNTTYVNNFKKKSFYIVGDDIVFDTHYNNDEYKYLNYLILDSTLNNYEIKEHLIELDRELIKLNKEAEMQIYNKNTSRIVEDIIIDHSHKIKDLDKRKQFLSVCRSYLLERYPYDFAFLDYFSIENCKKYIKR